MVDFEVPERLGLRQTIADTLGATGELARDLGVPLERIRYRAGGIDHMSFFLRFEEALPDGGHRDLYPALKQGYAEGRLPRPENAGPRRPNRLRREVMRRLGFLVTESSEHFAECVAWFIKQGRPDLIDRFGSPLDENPKRCVEQVERWEALAEEYRSAETIAVGPSHEYASDIVGSVVTGAPSVI